MAQFLAKPELAPELPADAQVARLARTPTLANRDMPILLFGEFLRVVNEDNPRVFRYFDATDKCHYNRQITGTWHFQWNRKHYVLAPGESAFVPFEALVDALGDPRSMDEPVPYNDGNGDRGVILKRHDQLSGLFGRYAIRAESIEMLMEAAPKLSVYTLSDQRVVFPAMRPDMLPYPAPNVQEHRVDSSSRAITDRLEAENEELRSRMARYEAMLEQIVDKREGLDTPEA